MDGNWTFAARSVSSLNPHPTPPDHTMSLILRRALTTGAGPSNSLPLAVRRRRAELAEAVQKASPLTSPEKFTGPDAKPFPARMEEEFQDHRAAGNFTGDEATARAKFLEVNQKWRSRVRGATGAAALEGGAPTPETKWSFFERAGEGKAALQEGMREAIVGQKIWLPNIQIRLVRNHTPPGEAYDPWKATFRIPTGMTKTDLRSYLLAVYGLEVTYIRTDVYTGNVVRTGGAKFVREGGRENNYKRAIVGLKEPFHYPDDVEEMRAGQWGTLEEGAAQAAARESLLNKEFAIEQVTRYRAALKLKSTKGWRWRGNHGNAVSYCSIRVTDARETPSARSWPAVPSARPRLRPRPRTSPSRTPRSRSRPRPRPSRPRSSRSRPSKLNPQYICIISQFSTHATTLAPLSSRHMDMYVRRITFTGGITTLRLYGGTWALSLHCSGCKATHRGARRVRRRGTRPAAGSGRSRGSRRSLRLDGGSWSSWGR